MIFEGALPSAGRKALWCFSQILYYDDDCAQIQELVMMSDYSRCDHNCGNALETGRWEDATRQRGGAAIVAAGRAL
jgi:hypothetical protein